MVGKEAIATHLKASSEYLEVAEKLEKAGEYFAAVLCAATGVERAAMALILHLGGRPASRHRHHEVLKILQPLVEARERERYRKVAESIAELMGHLTMVRYKYEVAGEYKTPKEIYDEKTGRRLCGMAKKAIDFIKRYIGAYPIEPKG
jgi:HEPN domain-containing protein